jgi:hypothetical protein
VPREQRSDLPVGELAVPAVGQAAPAAETPQRPAAAVVLHDQQPGFRCRERLRGERDRPVPYVVVDVEQQPEDGDDGGRDRRYGLRHRAVRGDAVVVGAAPGHLRGRDHRGGHVVAVRRGREAFQHVDGPAGAAGEVVLRQRPAAELGHDPGTQVAALAFGDGGRMGVGCVPDPLVLVHGPAVPGHVAVGAGHDAALPFHRISDD